VTCRFVITYYIYVVNNTYKRKAILLLVICQLVDYVNLGEMTNDGYTPVRLVTSRGGGGRGGVDCRYYYRAGASNALIWVGGVGGGWDTPARGLYPHLCQKLIINDINSLRVCFRYPTDLCGSVLDVIEGIRFLEQQGIESVGLVGHSFGGAVVIQAAAAAASSSDTVRTVVTLSTQSHGAEGVSPLKQGSSILLIHGTDYKVLPPYCSSYVYNLANHPKEIIFYKGATHGLDEAAEQVHQMVHDWLVKHLKKAGL
jgi:cephalosporin-C deacetylase-like acetyl esterase